MSTGPVFRQLGHLIREARVAAKLSQTKVADSIGITPPSMSYIETGRNRTRIDMLIDICRIVGADPAALLAKAIERAENGAPIVLSKLTVRDRKVVVSAEPSARNRRRQLKYADPRYCNQWNSAPKLHETKGGMLVLRSKCGVPATFDVFSHGTADYTCDMHLAQAVKAMGELEGSATVDVIRKGK